MLFMNYSVKKTQIQPTNKSEIDIKDFQYIYIYICIYRHTHTREIDIKS